MSRQKVKLDQIQQSGATTGQVPSWSGTEWVPGSGAGITVQDENSTVATGVTQLDFQGGAVVASAGTGEVVVTITGGELLMQDGVTGPPVPIETEARDDWLYQG